jgi:hypothetical protein
MVLPSSKKQGQDKVGGKKILTGIWRKRQIDYVDGEVVLKLSVDKSQEKATMDRLLGAELKGAKVIRPFDRFNVGVVQVDGDVIKACEALHGVAGIAFAEPNMVDRACATVPTDASYAAEQWSLPLIGMPDAWDIERGEPTVMIAIVDSGIPMTGTPLVLSHPDLNDTTRILLGNDLVNGTATPRDDCGHGTHVAGIATAQSNNATGIAGVSWNTLLYVVKVFDSTGHGTSQRFHDAVVEAVDYADAHGLRCVINYSGGGGEALLKEQAVTYARDHNAVVVAAAGNDYGGSVIFPAAYSATYDNVIAVSATDAADVLAGYSNLGPEVNVAAPGSGIYSCMPNYAVYFTTTYGYSQNYDHMDGTSMAAPHVAGLAALLLSYDATLGADEVRHTIEENAHDLGPAGWDQSYGYGRIDAHAALDSLVPPEVCPLKTEGFCLYVKEACAKKEFCLYVKEVGACTVIKEVCIAKAEQIPCSLIKEVGPCIKQIEATTPCRYVVEAGCLREMCTREMGGMGCMRENPGLPWEQVIIRKGDPTAEPMVIKRSLKHVTPLTRRAAPLSHNKFRK